MPAAATLPKSTETTAEINAGINICSIASLIATQVLR
jgi:hypothetical protein